MRTGRVFLVGAGPGDPELLTLRAARVLAGADLVFYDALVDRRVLGLAPRAEHVDVGKRSGRHNVGQRTIEELLVEGARAGLSVVRLKAGDPFVFGRGGEEALACEAAGVPVEIVPGLTSAIAGPAAAGIPVTHRGVSGGVLVLTAHPADYYRRVLPALEPGAVTVILLMALAARGEISRDLTAAGWPRALPAAIVLGASTPRQWSWVGSLGELADVELPADRSDLPGLVVLGPTVSLAAAIRRAGADVERVVEPVRNEASRHSRQEEHAWLPMEAR
jgi:uroporphyrin-III C-methyltransferase